jgi:hypothetical protein
VDLASGVSFGFAEFGQLGLGRIEGVEVGQAVDQGQAHLLQDGRLLRQVGRQLFADNSAAPPFHQVKRRPQHARIVAKMQRPGRGRITRAQPGQDAKLPGHVVSGLDLVAEGRPAQHPFVGTPAHQVRQIGVAVRKLRYLQGSLAPRKMLPKVLLQRRQC